MEVQQTTCACLDFARGAGAYHWHCSPVSAQPRSITRGRASGRRLSGSHPATLCKLDIIINNGQWVQSDSRT
eukprot:9635437-Lingulodinium_polyedra.AAC.1